METSPLKIRKSHKEICPTRCLILFVVFKCEMPVCFQANNEVLSWHLVRSYLIVSNYKQILLNIPKFGVDFFAVLKREISNASLFSSSLFC